MPSRNYLSRYVSQHIACWLEVELHRIDTHAYLSAALNWRRDGKDRTVHTAAFFSDWVCDRCVLLDWIKRDVVTRVTRAPRDHNDRVQEGAWEELQQTLEAAAPFISVPLSDEAEEHNKRCRHPSSDLWYEIVMPAVPVLDAGPYRQEYYACVAEDFGEVIGIDEAVEVPFGSFTGCLKTRDTTPLDPSVEENKYYCPDVGLVLAVDLTTDEREELTTVTEAP